MPRAAPPAGGGGPRRRGARRRARDRQRGGDQRPVGVGETELAEEHETGEEERLQRHHQGDERGSDQDGARPPRQPRHREARPGREQDAERHDHHRHEDRVQQVARQVDRRERVGVVLGGQRRGEELDASRRRRRSGLRSEPGAMKTSGKRKTSATAAAATGRPFPADRPVWLRSGKAAILPWPAGPAPEGRRSGRRPFVLPMRIA